MRNFSLFVTMLGAFVLTFILAGKAYAGPCEDQCNVKYLPGPKLTACLNNCGTTTSPSSSGGSSSGGGHVDWCKKLETCTAEFLELIPECDTEEVVFDGTNCRAQYKSCKDTTKVATQINTLCTNKKGDCEMEFCAYTGTELPVGSCPDGCPRGYTEADGKCVPDSCEPVCADTFIADFKNSIPGFPLGLLYLLLGMGALGIILLFALLARKPKKEPEPPFSKCPKCKEASMQNGKCRNHGCWHQLPAKPAEPKPAEPKPAEPESDENKPTRVMSTD